GAIVPVVWRLQSPGNLPSSAGGLSVDEELSWGGGAAPFYQNRPKLVPVNRTAEVLDGFRGGVHPVLHGQTRLAVSAFWTPIGEGRSFHYVTPPEVYEWYTGLRPARPQPTYGEREFFAMLTSVVWRVMGLVALQR